MLTVNARCHDIKAWFAGLVPANQPAGSPLEIEPVSAVIVFFFHNNQPVSAKILPAERDLRV